jgi:hypothetical protein
MKELAKSNNSKFTDNLIKKGQVFNKNVNSPEFQRKCLENAGIEFTDDNLIEVYNKYQSAKFNNVKVYRKKIDNAIKRYPEHELINILKETLEWSDDELMEKYKDVVHGIFTSLNFEKRGTKKIPITCSKGTVMVRSSYEKNYIEFFDNEHIEWYYEPRWFRLPNNRVYLPDFKVIIDEKVIWIEVKGAFWGHQKEQDYMENIVNPFTEMVKPDKFIMTFEPKPTIKLITGEINA